MTRARPVALLGVVAAIGAASSALASGPAPRLRTGHDYWAVLKGRAGKNLGVGIDLEARAPTLIGASRVNTAPEQLHSNINVSCTNKAQVDTGMPKIKLAMRRGRYSFSVKFTVHAEETYPVFATHEFKVSLSGSVVSSKEIDGSVSVSGPAGCSVAKSSYRAKLASWKPK